MPEDSTNQVKNNILERKVNSWMFAVSDFFYEIGRPETKSTKDKSLLVRLFGNVCPSITLIALGWVVAFIIFHLMTSVFQIDFGKYDLEEFNNRVAELATGPHTGDSDRTGESAGDATDASSALPVVRLASSPADLENGTAEGENGNAEGIYCKVSTSNAESPVFALLERKTGEQNWNAVVPRVKSQISPEALVKVVSILGDSAGEEQLENYSENLQQLLDELLVKDLNGFDQFSLGLQRRIGGTIQFLATWVFGVLLVVVVSRAISFGRFNRAVRESQVYGRDSQPTPWGIIDRKGQEFSEAYESLRGEFADKENALDEKLKGIKDNEEGKKLESQFQRAYDRAFTKLQEQLATDSADLLTGYEEVGDYLKARNAATIAPHVELWRSGLLAFKIAESKVDSVSGYVNDRANILLDQLESSRSLLKYLVWLIPTIGFLGTVYGISEAVLLTNQLESIDEIRRAVGQSATVSGIGIAF